MRNKYHIGDQVFFFDSYFRPVADEVIDIDARTSEDGLTAQYLLANGRHYQEVELYPNRVEAKAFFAKNFEKILLGYNATIA